MPMRVPPSSAGAHLATAGACRNSSEPSRHARQAGAEAAVVAGCSCSSVTVFCDLLPLHAEGRVATACSRSAWRQLASSVSVLPSMMLLHVVALDQHVGLADGVGLGVQLLPVERRARRSGSTRARYSSATDSMPPVPAAGRRWCAPRLAGRALRCLGEQQVDHQADHVARREVLAGGLVGESRRTCGSAPRRRAPISWLLHRVGMQVDAGEAAASTRYSRLALASC